MYVHVHIRVVPLGVGTSISDYVAEAVKVLKELGYDPLIESGGTAIQLENLEEIGKIVRIIHQRLIKMGVQRILTYISIDHRLNKTRSITDKINVVKTKLRKL